MTRRLTTLAIALVVIWVVGALAASAALAVEGNGAFVCENAAGTATQCKLHGEQVSGEKHVFTLTTASSNHKTECTTATFTGTVTGGTSSTVEVHPEYSGCTSFGLSSSITTTGCNYLFHITKTLANATDYDADFDVVCEAGKSIVINAGFGECKLTINGQTGLSTIEAINMTGATTVQNDVTAKTNLANLSYTVANDGPFCPLSGTGPFGGGDINGTTTVTATEDVVGGAALGTKIEMGAAVEDNGAFVCENAAGSATQCKIYGAQVSGEKHVVTLTTAGGVTHKTECSAANFTGTVSGGTSSTVEVHPEYSGCSSFGLGATITTTGCNYVIHITKTLANATDYDADFAIVCEAGKSIVINAGFGECELKIDGQTGLSTIEAINMTGATTIQNDVTTRTNLSGIAYTVTKDGPFCPLSGIGTFSGGDITGNTTFTATEDHEGAAALGTKIEMGEFT